MTNTKHQSTRQQSIRIAFCGMMVALSVVLMLTGGLVPIMTYVSPMVAGLLLLPILMDFGRGYAWTVWAAASIIVLLLGADKEAAFFYLFIGYYPIIKWQLDRQKHKLLQLLAKIGLFSFTLGAMYAILAFVLHLDGLLAEFGEMGSIMTVCFFILLILCMLLYDRMLLPMAYLYNKKIRPRLTKLNSR